MIHFDIMNPTVLEISRLLGPYQKKIDEALSAYDWGKNPLAEACHYVLINGGKRFRPAIVLMIGRAMHAKASLLPAALAIEFFHTASLVADDLPCMDDDDFRRGKASLHKAFSEDIALLASYALIAEGYGLLAKMEGDSKLIKLALENCAYNTGINGASGGQYLDLYPRSTHLEDLIEAIEKKTVALFESAFVLGWLFSGGDLNRLETVKKAARSFGLAFQIADDLEDLRQDSARKGAVNIPFFLGEEKAYALLKQEIEAFLVLLKELNLNDSDLAVLVGSIRPA